jgi:predicted permease
MWRDFRHAVRALRTSALFTGAAVLALGLAIGANAAIFGLVDALWFRPPGVRDAGALVRIFATTETDQTGLWSFPEYRDIRDKTGAFDGVIARGRRGAVLPAADGAEQLVLVNVVSTNFFTTLGVQAQHGRLFTPADESSLEATPGIILGHAFWRERFGGDRSVVGRRLNIGRGGSLAVVVLGVLPETFRDLDAAADRDLWIPTPTWSLLNGRDEFERRDERWFDLLARRRADVPVAAAQAEVAALAAAMSREFGGTSAGRSARVIPELSYRLEAGGVNALTLLGLVLLVVLITCVNVANLLLARAAARSRDLAVRVAMGATRLRLARQLMAESALLGALGAMAGLTIATWLIRLMPAIIGAPPGFRSFLVFETDARVIAFTLILTLFTTMLFGIAPSWSAASGDVSPILKSSSGPGGGLRRRSGLVTTQVSVSLVLLVAAGVLARSFVAAGTVDLGFGRRPILTAWSTSGNVAAETKQEAVRRLEGLPGVEGVAAAIRAPLSLSGSGLAQGVYFSDRPPAPGEALPQIKFNAVSASYFAVLDISVRRGRTFDATDERAGEPVIIVNERFASRYFPGRDPVGAIVRLGDSAGREHRIVGVVENTAINRVGEPPEPYFYLPYWRGNYGEITFFLHSGGTAATLGAATRDVLQRLDRRLQPRLLITMAEYIAYSTSTYQATATLAVALGGLGLLLTAIGAYGVMAYRTTRRTREIGIRVALGAANSQVMSMILREGVSIALLGIALGIPLALIATHSLSSLLFGIRPWDFPSFVVATAVLVCTIAVATLVPAIRASRVDPSVALRDS